MTAGINPVRSAVIRDLLSFSHYDDDASYPTDRTASELRDRMPGLLHFVESRLGVIATPSTVVSETRMFVVDKGLLTERSVTKDSANVSAIVALETVANMPITTSRKHRIEGFADYSGVWVESPSALWMLRPTRQFDGYPHPFGSVGPADMQVFGDVFHIADLWKRYYDLSPRFDARIGRDEITQRIIKNSIGRSSNSDSLDLDTADITAPSALFDEPLQEGEIDRYAEFRRETEMPIIYGIRNQVMSQILECTLDELELQVPAYDYVDDALENDPVQVFSPKYGYAILLRGLGIRNPEDLEEELSFASRKVHRLMTPSRTKNIQAKTAFLSDIDLR